MARKKVLFVELNEICWSVIDRLIAERGPDYLTNLSRLRSQGTWGAPTALEQPPLLDPWVTWVTVHTGVTQEIHGAKVLEQDVEAFGAKRTWEYVAEAGRSVGVFGSVGAYPPKPVDGFMVPGPFAPGNDTYPEELQPVQALNRGHTRAHGANEQAQSLAQLAISGLKLFGLGLRPMTCLRIAAQLVRERVTRHSGWRRVVLQPLVNYDFFAAQYRRARPDFATWHSNHAAHFMHHYWRAWSDEGFKTKGPSEERGRYGEAVPTGYKVCDELLGRFMRLMDDDTVLVVCSSMGQQPFVNAAYRDGKVIVRLKNLEQFVALLGADGVTEVVPTMVPQFNLRIPDQGKRAAISGRLSASTRIVNGVPQQAIVVEETGEILTVTPLGLSERAANIRFAIPGVEAEMPFEELFAMDAPTVKQGMHHPEGLFIAYGRGVPAGKRLGECTNLDIAPTLLTLMGVPVPTFMRGHNLLGVAA